MMIYQKAHVILLIVVLLGTCRKAGAQYYDQKIDYDSTYEFGTDIAIKPNGSICIFGTGLDFTPYVRQLEWVVLSSSGEIASLNATESQDLWYGLQAGKGKQIGDSLFTSTFSFLTYNSQNYIRCISGIKIININSGISVTEMVYPDSAQYEEFAKELCIVNSGSLFTAGYYILADSDNVYPSPRRGLLIKTNGTGNLLWKQHHTGLPNGYQSIDYVGGDTLLLGGYELEWDPVNVKYLARPHFQLLDTAGTVLYDKPYPTGYRGGGNIYKDKNGGYYHWGLKDSLVLPADPLNFQNHPGYLAHLDDSFHFNWTHVFYDALQTEPINMYHISVQNVLQLHDSSYLIMATRQNQVYQGAQATVAKLSRTGELLWQQDLHVDTGTYDCYLVDAVEKPDHTILLVGEARDAFAPEWRGQDFWLVGLDSNGCPTANCMPLAVPHGPAAGRELSIYPNPTTGSITVTLPEAAILNLYNLQGQQAGSFRLQSGANQLQMPPGLPAGIYFGAVRYPGGRQQIVRIAYEP